MQARIRELTLIILDGLVVFLGVWAIFATGWKLEWHPNLLQFPSPFQIALAVSLVFMSKSLFLLAWKGEVSRPGLESLKAGWEFLRVWRSQATLRFPRRAG